VPYNQTTYVQNLTCSKREAMAQWSDKETANLIEIWGEQAIKEQLKRNVLHMFSAADDALAIGANATGWSSSSPSNQRSWTASP